MQSVYLGVEMKATKGLKSEKQSAQFKSKLCSHSPPDSELTSEIPPFQARLTATILAGLKRDLKAIYTSWSLQRIGFQAESKQVTSLEVITQVGYLAGQTNKAASWHPADRSKPRLTGQHANSGVLEAPPPLLHCGSLVYLRMRTCVVLFAVAFPSVECYECGWKMERNQSRLWPWQSTLHVKLLRVNGAEQQRSSKAAALVVLAVGPCPMCLSCDSSIKTPCSVLLLFALFSTFEFLLSRSRVIQNPSMHASAVPTSSCAQGCISLLDHTSVVIGEGRVTSSSQQ